MTQTVEKPANGTGGMRPWLKVVLFVSLALNVAVAGIVIGVAVKFGPPPDGHRPPRQDMIVGPYTHALSREDKIRIGKQLRKDYRDQAGPSRAARAAEFQEVLGALRATPYDGTKVEAILMRQLRAGAERQELGQRLLLDRLSRMTDAERATYADRLEEGLKRARAQRSDRD
ncbi:periplasmic heavy metal sensor [Thalassovita sp.]|uniref:periplasmic heavy metal sensor n=1 Tax=Thalassovita sp. TaxID=1979401 RepID=UPI0029DE80E2|nr:periplasmic heavy metal sensor [Thalassovita sp.]